MNRHDPMIKGEDLSGKLTLHVIKSQAAPMVHVTRSIRPELVLFGEDQWLQTPFTLEAGKTTVVKADSPDRVLVSRFALGEADREIITTARVEDVVRAVIEAGGHYPDIVHFLHAAKQSGALSSRFEVEAVPQAGRRYDRPQQDGGDKAESSNFEVLGSLPNLFGRRDPESAESNDSMGGSSDAAGSEAARSDAAE
jgi:hypothetical protein